MGVAVPTRTGTGGRVRLGVQVAARCRAGGRARSRATGSRDVEEPAGLGTAAVDSVLACVVAVAVADVRLARGFRDQALKYQTGPLSPRAAGRRPLELQRAGACALALPRLASRLDFSRAVRPPRRDYISACFALPRARVWPLPAATLPLARPNVESIHSHAAVTSHHPPSSSARVLPPLRPTRRPTYFRLAWLDGPTVAISGRQ